MKQNLNAIWLKNKKYSTFHTHPRVVGYPVEESSGDCQKSRWIFPLGAMTVKKCQLDVYIYVFILAWNRVDCTRNPHVTLKWGRCGF